MDVGRLPSHGSQQTPLLALRLQGSQFDTRTMGTEAADNPSAAQLHKRIKAAHCPGHDRLIKNLGGPFAVGCPIVSGRDQSLRLASNPPAAPVGDGNVAGVAEAA